MPASKSKLGLGAWLAIGWLTLLVVVSIVVSFTGLGLNDPMASNANLAGKGPSLAHPFGGDGIARDVFSRAVHGAKNTLIVAVGAVLIGLVIGGLLGLIAGYFGGTLDKVLSSSFNILLAFPQLVLALAMVSVWAGEPDTPPQRRLLVLTLALGIVAIPILARITRANTLAWSQREFVTAAKAMGAKWYRVLFRDVLPNVVPAMMSITLLGVAIGIVAESGLAILGLGVQVPEPSWGNIIAGDRSNIRFVPWAVFGPVLMIFITVLALNYLGDVIQKRFDVRESLL